MKEEHGYFDYDKFEEIKKNIDSFIDSVKSVIDSVKYLLAKILPDTFKGYMMSSIGDFIVFFVIVLVIYLILKIFGFAFKIILRIIYLILILASAYIIYVNYFYHH